jgi:hypothetical protein
MQVRSLGAQTSIKTAAPLRVAFLYVPNGVHMPGWVPSAPGPLGVLPPILAPLEKLRSEILVLSGLALNPARALGDGGGDHARAMASFLTGQHPRKTDGADLKAGVSVDQLAARAVGQATRFPSLELGCEGGRNGGECDHGYSCAYQSNLSWSGESTPVAKQINPRLVFERLFGGTDEKENRGTAAQRERLDKSILDFVGGEAQRLKKALGTADRHKLDEYLTSVREIESRIGRARPPMDLGGKHYPRPHGIPSDLEQHIRLMGDLLVLAFQCDLTRIATFVFGNDGSNRPYTNIGVSEGHHDLSHHGGDRTKQAKIQQINRFHVSQLAYMLEKMRSISEGEGTLLDHALIVYGSGISDGNLHAHEDLPILVAGKGGGTIAPGRHLRFAGETPLSNLHLAVLRRMVPSAERFGDSSGSLHGLDG